MFDDQRDYVQLLTNLFPQEPFAPMGQWYLNHSSVPRMDREYDYINDILHQRVNAPEQPLTGLYPAFYGKGTGHVFVRTDWSTGATYLSFIAGPYTESHAHRDQGSFNIFKNEWLAFDEGVMSSSGLRADEASHNIPAVIAGGRAATMDYDNDGTMVAVVDNAQYTYLASDTANCYAGSGGVTQMEREIVFVKPDTLIVFDRVQASAGSQKVWRLNTPVRPTVSGRVATMAGTRGGRLTLTPVLPAGVTPAVVDWAATVNDFDGGYRIDLSTTGNGRAVFLNVLSLNNAVTAVTESSPAGMYGATLTLADGRSVTVQFAEATLRGDPRRHRRLGPGDSRRAQPQRRRAATLRDVIFARARAVRARRLWTVMRRLCETGARIVDQERLSSIHDRRLQRLRPPTAGGNAVSTPSAAPKGRHDSARIPSLDGLRALSIVLVLFAHATQGLAGLEAFGTLSTFGVRVFFVISGYLITSLLLRRRRRPGRFRCGSSTCGGHSGSSRRSTCSSAWSCSAPRSAGSDWSATTCSPPSPTRPTTTSNAGGISATPGRSRWRSSSICSGRSSWGFWARSGRHGWRSRP